MSDPPKKKQRVNQMKTLFPGIVLPRNAYNLFQRESKGTIVDFKTAPTILGKLWGDMGEQEKTKWYTAAAADKLRYEKEVIEQYPLKYAEYKTSVTKKRKRANNSVIPAFQRYFAANFESYMKEHNVTYQETKTALGIRFKALSTEDKQEFIDAYQTEKKSNTNE